MGMLLDIWLAIKIRSYRDHVGNTIDLAAILLLTAFLYSYIQFYVLPPKREPGYSQFFTSPQAADGLVRGNRPEGQEATRDISARLKQTDKDVVIFWGSQSGNAARLAKQFARELQYTHGIAAIAEDMSAYDHQHLTSLPSSAVVGFIVSTFGEGDPPDNATELFDCLSEWQSCESTRVQLPLSNLQYFAFGLGSRKYQYYNRFVDAVDEFLAAAGATRLGYVGKQDEMVRSDCSWTEWKESIVKELSKIVPKRATAAQKSPYEPDIKLVASSRESNWLSHPDSAAEHISLVSTSHMRPYVAGVAATRLLSSKVGVSSMAARTYIHMEFDTSNAGAGLVYKTGDHVAIWTQNTIEEVLRLARLFGWDEEKLHSSIKIRPLSDNFNTTNFPSDTTSLYALLRCYLDISGPVTQESGRLLAHFAPTETARAAIAKLLSHDDTWRDQVIVRYLTLGKIMELVEPRADVVWPADLFTMLIQTTPRLQPRYFSIASAPMVSQGKLAITVGVVVTNLLRGGQFYGLATNHLHALHRQGSSPTAEPSSFIEYSISGSMACMHIRPSNFKPPSDESRPVLMIAAGSGIAPFLAFAQEREALYKAGQKVGRMVLVFGCRAADQDYLYAEEWTRLQEYGFFTVYTAFSRSGQRKRYVQHVIEERGQEMREMILEGSAACYICGSINMATEVKASLAKVLIGSERTWEEGRDYIQRMKSNRMLQEDVWA